MLPVVVDTNVAMVANDLYNEFPDCVRACTERLNEIQRSGRIVVDDAWHILKEYMRNLRSSGQPGVGEAFLKWVLTNRANPDRCILVRLTSSATRTFEEFPDDPRLSDFDPDDRKFVAVALGHEEHPPILQALDSKWWGYRAVLAENAVTVDFLCAKNIEVLYERKVET